MGSSSRRVASIDARNAVADHGWCRRWNAKARCSSSGAEVARHAGRVRVGQQDLAEQDPVTGVGVDEAPPAPMHLVYVVDVEGVPLLHARIARHVGRRAVAPRVVAQVGVFEEPVSHVDAKAVDVAVEPESDDVIEIVGDGRLPPIQVRLLGGEEVEVPLPAGVVSGPRRPPEHRQPVVRRPAPHAVVGPDVTPPVGVMPIGPSVGEPHVLARGVVRHQIEQHPHAGGMGVGDERVEVIERAVPRVDAAVVGHVVAVVEVRRRVARRDPHGVDTEASEVREPRPQAGEVAQAVPVGVGEAPQVHLVEDRVAPPRHPLLSAVGGNGHRLDPTIGPAPLD